MTTKEKTPRASIIFLYFCEDRKTKEAFVTMYASQTFNARVIGTATVELIEGQFHPSLPGEKK